MKKYSLLQWVLSLIASLLLLQSLFFKFSGAEESIFIFSTLGIEPWGRYASGVVELIAGILLLIPSLRVFGAILGLGVISGAIIAHLTQLGIEVQGDGGQLFAYALLILFSCFCLIYLNLNQILTLIHKK